MTALQRPTDHDRTASAKSRAVDNRVVDERPPLDNWSPASVLATPPSTGEWRYRWIAEFVNGAYLSNNVQSALREGYVRVRIDDLPEEFVVDEDTRGDGYARQGGLILMRFPQKFARQRQEYYARRSRDAIQSANQLQGVAGKDAVYEDRGNRSVTGREAAQALNAMTR